MIARARCRSSHLSEPAVGSPLQRARPRARAPVGQHAGTCLRLPGPFRPPDTYREAGLRFATT
eukprot:6676553-Prymnesium_polylepis.1